MFESFQDKTRRDVIDGSQEVARALGHNYVGTEHLLLALLAAEQRDGGGPLADRGLTSDTVEAAVVDALAAWAAVSEATALRSVGVDPEALEAAGRAGGVAIRIQGLTAQPPPPPGVPENWGPITPRTKTVLEMSFALAGNDAISNRHVLMAILEEGGGLAAVVLESLGVSPEAFAADLRAGSA